MIDQFTFNAIGKVHSPYKEKFAIPRQPGIVSAAKGSVTLINDANNSELVRGLEQFSHLWVMFIFHDTMKQGWKPLVRPPRLGGNKKMGVLATRSTFRPNPLGMSVVKLESIATENNIVTLHISGLDLLDETPVVDIKPYINYSDSIPQADSGFAQNEPKINITVSFADEAMQCLHDLEQIYPCLKTFITQVLEQDPRPAYKKLTTDDKIYGMTLYHFNIRWKFSSHNVITVLDVEK